MFSAQIGSCVDLTIDSICYETYITLIYENNIYLQYINCDQKEYLHFDGKTFRTWHYNKIPDNLKFWNVQYTELFNFTSLPIYVQINVCKYLDQKELYNLSKTKRFYYQLYTDKLPISFNKYGDLTNLLFSSIYENDLSLNFRPKTMSARNFYLEVEKYRNDIEYDRIVNISYIHNMYNSTYLIQKYIENNKYIALVLFTKDSKIENVIDLIRIIYSIRIAACCGYLYILQYIEFKIPGFVLYCLDGFLYNIALHNQTCVLKWLFDDNCNDK